MAMDEDLRTAIAVFPGTFERALSDWAKFKAGVDRGLFAGSTRAEIVDWYKDFPTLWETIRPNFVKTVRTAQGSMIDPTYVSLVGRVDRFVKQLGSDLAGNQLGLAPLIIAGIIIAGGLGLAGATWMISYLAKQANVSRLIDEVTAGRISPEILKAAIESERSLTNPISDLTGSLKWVVAGALLFFAMPLIERLVSRATSKS